MPPASELRCRVATPKGSALSGDPVRHALVCPADCCYFPDTLVNGGRPLEAIVCVSKPGSPGETVAVNPIALLRARDRDGDSQSVVCVPRTGSRWSRVRHAHDLPEQLQAEIERFITSRLPADQATEIVAWCSRDEALKAIDDAAARWAATVNGRA